MQRRSRWVAASAATILVLTIAATAMGYTGQVEGSITVAGDGSTACGPRTVTATLLDADGNPVEGQSVAWILATTLSPEDAVINTPTTTNAQGVATTTVLLGCVTGSRTVRAMAGDVAGQAELSAVGRGLPNTSTLPTQTPAQPMIPGAVLLLVVLASLAGLALRRLALARR